MALKMFFHHHHFVGRCSFPDRFTLSSAVTCDLYRFLFYLAFAVFPPLLGMGTE